MKLLATSALALALATTGVWAESHTNMTEDRMTSEQMLENRDMLIRTRDITGGEIYTMNEADDEGWDGGYDAVGADWNDIGEIEDIVLDRNGQLVGVVAEVGGFLDIGDKHVMIAMDDVQLVPTDDRTYKLVTRLSEEQLEEMEGVDEGFWD